MAYALEDHEWRHCQHWRQNNHRSLRCWWRRWLSRRGWRTGKISCASSQGLHSLRHEDQSKWKEAWSLSTWAQLYLTRFPSLRYSPRQHTRQQHLQGWNQFGTTGAFLSVPKPDWCAPLSYPSSCMFVNHGPSQKSCKEYEPWKWGATARCYAFHTKTMLPTRKSVPRSSR